VRVSWRVLVGSKSFGRVYPEHLARLEAAGCEVVPNAHGRPYTAAELAAALPGVHAIVTGTDELIGDVIRDADSLVTIAKHGVGLDTVDLAAAAERGIVVTYAPAAVHDSVADLAIALLLALARRLPAADASVRAGRWEPFPGTELRGKLLGLVGFGRVARGVARRARAFGMEVVAHDPFVEPADGVDLLPLHDLLGRADALSLHAASSPGAPPLLGRDELAAMMPGALLVNTARGGLVDEDALAEALREGRLGGAALDVFRPEPPRESPLLRLPNVVLTPHVGGQTREALRRMGELTVENCLAALRGDPPAHVAGVDAGEAC
jgi:phosphoglycerate dehydrogenase-like enzyme